LIDRPRAESLAHKQAESDSRPPPRSFRYYSDRLLASGQRLPADAPVDQGLQHDRDDDDQAEGELGVEGVDAGRHDAGVDRADDERGDEGADDRARAAEHRRAAEEDRGDGV